MTPVVPSIVNNIHLAPGISLITRKHSSPKRFNLVRCSTKQTLSPQKYILSLSTPLRLFPQPRINFALHRKPRATGTDVAVEEAGSPVSNEDPSSATAESSDKSAPTASPVQSKRSRHTRKSEMPPVKPEELVPGATFTGKVRSIQPFGAFVDFGAFTDGLVHVSQLSDGYVKDIGSVVSVGQEVTVRLVEANKETSRISLTMRNSDDNSKQKGPTEKSRPPRKGLPKSNQKREDTKKASKFVKGQDLDGTVKSLTRSGAFITLQEGGEGFLPQDEEADGGFVANMMGGSSLQLGQEVSVRVLRVSRGQVTLTMKKEEDAGELDSKLNLGVVHRATNPFLLAFRQNEDIASFLDKREKEETPAETPAGDDASIEDKVEISSKVAAAEEEVSVSEEFSAGEDTSVENKVEISSTVAATEEDMSVTEDVLVNEDTSIEEKVEISSEVATIEEDVSVSEEVFSRDGFENELMVTDSVATEEVRETQVGEDMAKNEVEVPQSSLVEDVSSPTIPEDEKVDDAIEENEVTKEAENVVNEVAESQEDDVAKDENEEAKIEDNTVVTCSSTIEENEISREIENTGTKLEVETKTPDTDDEVPSAKLVEEKVDSAPEETTKGAKKAENVVEEVAESKEYEVTAKDQNEETNTGTLDTDIEVPTAPLVEEEKVDSTPEETTKEIEESKVMNVNETPMTPIEEDTKVKPVPEEKIAVTNSSEENSVPSTNGSATKATISPTLVKQLREETGAGMMDCKKALSETGGDLFKAQEFLRKKGLASADKKASRATAEGRIGSYIHDSRIGVLIEMNCETDFVSRGEIFKELVDDLAMQVVACPQVQYLATDDVDNEVIEKERAIEMQKEDLLSKPEQIREKIVDGRIRKRLEELALLEQPYIKNDKMVVKDWVKQTIATIGENIKVKRFVRFNLGEGLKKKSQDFAAEVAAQTTAKSAPSPVKDQPAAAVEDKPAVDKPKTAVSAALVKQLREETGAGMMDCKKALSETGGDLGKAQEYLRKKGLSTANKKSSRLAAEGRIGAYIHDSRIGVLIEVNCETDFVGRSEKFKELVDDLAMQVVACPQVQYVSIEDIPEKIVRKEKEMEMQREDLQSKPENIREKIVEGRVSKRLGELALLEQPFIKDDNLLVKDLVKQTVAGLGENIKVRRFVRFTLGEVNES